MNHNTPMKSFGNYPNVYGAANRISFRAIETTDSDIPTMK
jgi:hypothetical protein